MKKTFLSSVLHILYSLYCTTYQSHPISVLFVQVFILVHIMYYILYTIEFLSIFILLAGGKG
jgi:hypothetical protein